MEKDVTSKLVYISGRGNVSSLYKIHEEFGQCFPKARVYMNGSDRETTYVFEDLKEKEGFEKILREHNILYSNVVPERKEPERPIELTYSKGIFRNGSSMVGFIKGYKSVDDVIMADSRGLEEISGSFKEIANRMESIIRFSKNIKRPNYEEWSPKLDGVIGKVEREYGEDWSDETEARAKVSLARNRILLSYPDLRMDEKVSVIDSFLTRGFQICPFEGCRETWNDDVVIFNPKTERELMINSGTVHLAKEHHLLEKGNEYGISAREFYKYFM